MIVVNFKNYKFGDDVLRIVKLIQKNKKIKNPIVCVSAPDIRLIASKTKLTVFAQHINDKPNGKTTGFLVTEAVKAAGAKGTLLNHSEHKLYSQNVGNLVKRCSEIGLKVILCVSSMRELRKYIKLNPYAMAFEDPKLIATGKSITTHNSRAIKKFVEKIKKSNSKIIPLCGAGISTAEDYKEALALGCKGVLVSSAVANSRNPNTFLKKIP